jgi:hypothetical protein
MIRQLTIKDKTSLIVYLSAKLQLSFIEAEKKAVKIIKSGFPNLILDTRELQGVCWIESKEIDNKKIKFVNILVNNWRIAEAFIKVLRWRLNGEYWFSLPKHDFLNRTFNKNGIRFMNVDGDKNIYCFKFELRHFINYKSEDE